MQIILSRVEIRCSIFPESQEVLMPTTFRFRTQQGQLFIPPPPQPKLPQEAYQRMLRLLARMMNEHLEKKLRSHAQVEVGDE
jgi:hypothetical protein